MNESPYTVEEARARFDAAVDGELDERERARFEAALAADAELAVEYQRHQAVVFGAKRLAEDVPTVDLLASVQQKLRARSGGKFYRDRFAQRTSSNGLMMVVIALSAVFLLGAVALLAYQMGWFVQAGEAAEVD